MKRLCYAFALGALALLTLGFSDNRSRNDDSSSGRLLVGLHAGE